MLDALKRLLYWIGVVSYFAALYLFVAFIVASFTATQHGPIRWDKGWQAVKDAYLPD